MIPNLAAITPPSTAPTRLPPAATNSGAAIVARPLPSADAVLAVHSFANRQPSGSATFSDATAARGSQRNAGGEHSEPAWVQNY